MGPRRMEKRMNYNAPLFTLPPEPPPTQKVWDSGGNEWSTVKSSHNTWNDGTLNQGLTWAGVIRRIIERYGKSAAIYTKDPRPLPPRQEGEYVDGREVNNYAWPPGTTLLLHNFVEDYVHPLYRAEEGWVAYDGSIGECLLNKFTYSVAWLPGDPR